MELLLAHAAWQGRGSRRSFLFSVKYRTRGSGIPESKDRSLIERHSIVFSGYRAQSSTTVIVLTLSGVGCRCC